MSKQGYCDDCGRWDSELVDGECPDCRARYHSRTLPEPEPEPSGPVPPALAAGGPALRRLAVLVAAAGSFS